MDRASEAQVEDVFQALLDYLVEPVLPLKSISHPDPSLQQSIAKQMHAVVLLYNYYHRRQFPHLELLDFETLCKMAVNAKPNLLVHLNYMKSCCGDGIYNNLSVTEKAIMDACNISIGINSLKDSPSMKGWPVSIVAIFLTDSEKRNCFLQYGTTTQGVWSLIEKSYSEYGNGLQGVLGTKQKTDSKLPAKVLKPDEAHFRKFATSAVQEITGICPDNLTILESHVTYSLHKEKSTAWLFIMKCNSVNDHVFEVPIQEVIESLQGPLVKKSCNTYIVADAVEHFHLLPYAGMIIDWFSREMLANASAPVNEHNLSKKSSEKNDECIASTGSEETSGNRQGANFLVLKTNKTGDLDKKENGSFHVSKHQNSNGSRSSLLLHLREESESTLEVLDNAVTKFSTECDTRSTKSGSEVKEDMGCSVREACNSEMDMVDSQMSASVCAGKNLTIIASEKVHGGARKGVQSSTEGKCMGNVEILKTKGSIDGDRKQEKTVMLKELANIKFPTDNNPDRPLHSSDKISLEDAILKVFADVETSSLIRRVQACQKWGETKDIRAEILSRRNDLLGQSRKRQRVSVGDVNSDIDLDSYYKISGGNIFMTNDDDGRLGHFPAINNSIKSSAGGCGSLESLPVVEGHQVASENIGVQADFNGYGLDIDLKGAMVVYAEEEEVQNALIPQSLPESIVSMGSVCFPQKYIDLYKRIVTKFGDVIMQESKEVTWCSDMVSAAMKGLLEVVDSMLQASSGAIDMEVLEYWEMKIRFCEFSGLKVGWLRSHFEKIRKIPVVRELEGHAAALEGCLEAKRKRAADLSSELEQVHAEENELMEKKRMVDADLEAARAKQECFSLDLF